MTVQMFKKLSHKENSTTVLIPFVMRRWFEPPFLEIRRGGNGYQHLKKILLSQEGGALYKTVLLDFRNRIAEFESFSCWLASIFLRWVLSHMCLTIQNHSTFTKPLCWISMLVFRDVPTYTWSLLLWVEFSGLSEMVSPLKVVTFQCFGAQILRQNALNFYNRAY